MPTALGVMPCPAAALICALLPWALLLRALLPCLLLASAGDVSGNDRPENGPDPRPPASDGAPRYLNPVRPPFQSNIPLLPATYYLSTYATNLPSRSYPCQLYGKAYDGCG